MDLGGTQDPYPGGQGHPHPPRPPLSGVVMSQQLREGEAKGWRTPAVTHSHPLADNYGSLHIPTHTCPGFVLQKRQTVDTVSESLYKGVCGGAILQPIYPCASGGALGRGTLFPRNGGFHASLRGLWQRGQNGSSQEIWSVLWAPGL